jgi:formylglycine-generating enzyme required for sulfatase activity
MQEGERAHMAQPTSDSTAHNEPAREQPTNAARPNIGTIGAWLRYCLEQSGGDTGGQSDERIRLLEEFTALPLDDVRLRLSMAVVRHPLPSAFAPEAAASLRTELTVAALWALLTSPGLTTHYWHNALAVLSSRSLARRTSAAYRAYLPLRLYGPRTTAGQQIDAIRDELARDLRDEQYLPGVRNLLDDLRNPQQGGRMLVQAFQERHPEALPKKMLLRALTAGAGARSLSSDPPELPSFPVSPSEWREELTHRNRKFGGSVGYWCYISANRYRIGGWEERKRKNWQGEDEKPPPDRTDARLTLPAYWVARFPITVAQFAPFVAEGYLSTAQHHWTPQGWQWRQQQGRMAPAGWSEPQEATAALPVVGVSWYEALAFCSWLTEQHADSLPPRFVFRLPTEAEWETAAAATRAMKRRPYPWGEERPNPDLALYGQPGDRALAPIGSRPAGAAACGAEDLVGLVAEWVLSRSSDYPARSAEALADLPTDAREATLRGGHLRSGVAALHNKARSREHPTASEPMYGLRVVLAPRKESSGA